MYVLFCFLRAKEDIHMKVNCERLSWTNLPIRNVWEVEHINLCLCINVKGHAACCPCQSAMEPISSVTTRRKQPLVAKTNKVISHKLGILNMPKHTLPPTLLTNVYFVLREYRCQALEQENLSFNDGQFTFLSLYNMPRLTEEKLMLPKSPLVSFSDILIDIQFVQNLYNMYAF